MASFSLFALIFGGLGELMDIQVKRAMRCKRLQMSFYSVFFLMFMGFYWIQTKSDVGLYSTEFLRAFGCMILVGAPGMIFCQFTGAASSTYFDGLYEKPLPLYRWLLSKYVMHVFVSTILLFISIPVIVYLKLPLLTLLAYYFLVIGMNYPIQFQNMVYYRNRFDIFEQASMNFSGWSLAQTLLSFTSFLAPIGLTIWLPHLMPEQTVYIIFIITGAVIAALHPLWLRNLCRRFEKKKYEMMESYRSK